jgi:hypothetical protein
MSACYAAGMKRKTHYRIQVFIGSLIGYSIVYFWLTPYIKAFAHYITQH